MNRRSRRSRHLIGALLCLGMMPLAPPAAWGQQADAPAVRSTVMQRISEISNQGMQRDNALAERVEFEKLDAEYGFLQKYNPTQATALRNSGGKFWSTEPGDRDLTVFHPRTTYQNGRPTWLASEAGRRPYTLPKKVCGPARNCLVQARLTTESDAAIAIDQIEVTAGQALPATLMLPVGEFNIDVQDAAGTQLRRWKAKISGARK